MPVDGVWATDPDVYSDPPMQLRTARTAMLLLLLYCTR